ncbi:hypothetical protein EC900091_2644, partial [Escherichia coli 90.0091]
GEQGYMKKTSYAFFFGSGFRDIRDTALKSAISGSIFPRPLACLVIRMALPLGSTRALPTHQAIRG